jgi:hypothetical protein
VVRSEVEITPDEPNPDSNKPLPKCPLCGSKTRLRTSKKDGSKYHVCVNYPECKGKVAFEDEWEDDWGDDWDKERPATEATIDRTQQQTNTDSSQPSKPTKQTEHGSPLILLGILGLFLFIGGICVLIYYWGVFDTSVPVPGGEVFGISRVNNLGLMQQQQNGIIIACVLAAFGIVGMVVGYWAGKKK